MDSKSLNNIDGDGYEELLRNAYYPVLPKIMNQISEKGYTLL